MKQRKIICVAGILIAVLFCVSIAAAHDFSMPDRGDSDSVAGSEWSALVESFQTLPDIQYASYDDSEFEAYVEPNIPPWLEEEIRQSDPRSVITYSPATGEVTLTPYAEMASGE